MAQKCRFSQGELGKLRQDDITASFSIPILQWFTETDSGPHEGNPEAGERARVFSRDGHQDAARSVDHTSVVLAAVCSFVQLKIGGIDSVSIPCPTRARVWQWRAIGFGLLTRHSLCRPLLSSKRHTTGNWPSTIADAPCALAPSPRGPADPDPTAASPSRYPELASTYATLIARRGLLVLFTPERWSVRLCKRITSPACKKRIFFEFSACLPRACLAIGRLIIFP